MADLIAELMAEKRNKILGGLKTPPKPLVDNKKVTVIVENPDNIQIKAIAVKVGNSPRVSNPTSTVYCQNNSNKKIATILNKFGNPEV